MLYFTPAEERNQHLFDDIVIYYRQKALCTTYFGMDLYFGQPKLAGAYTGDAGFVYIERKQAQTA